MYFGESSTILYEGLFNFKRLPKELQLDVSWIGSDASASKFKAACEKQIKYMEENDFGEKKISKSIYWLYYGILGNAFSNKDNKYVPKMSVLVPLLNKYCDDKQRSLIKKDIEQTIAAIEKLKERSELQEAWYKDIKANLNKIK